MSIDLSDLSDLGLGGEMSNDFSDRMYKPDLNYYGGEFPPQEMICEQMEEMYKEDQDKLDEVYKEILQQGIEYSKVKC